jgi:ABC-type histidine transport system ATPase subunit
MTCVIVTHEMGFAREVADEICFTDRGVVVEHGPPAEFFANCRDERTRRFRRGSVAAGGTGAAARDAGDWVPRRSIR